MSESGRGSVFFDLFVLQQRVRRLLSEAMAEGPLRPDEYAMYSAVFEDEAISPTAMAARLGMPLTTVADQIRAMEARGHCRRVPHPTDGRSYLIVLTAEGSRAHREANVPFERAAAAFERALPRSERAVRRELAALIRAADETLLSLNVQK